MEVERVLHMVGGDGETSYATNSGMQRMALSQSLPLIKDSVKSLLDSVTPLGRVVIADLGCSSGPNTLRAVHEIIKTICSSMTSTTTPEFLVFLNDLPCNDFNTLFQSLPSFHEKLREELGGSPIPSFISAMPGSFYGRLFPTRSIQFVHSCYSLQWLSQVPRSVAEGQRMHLNRGNVTLSSGSQQPVFEDYLKQFQRDFYLFLRMRSEEIAPGGQMVISLKGRRNDDRLGVYHTGWPYISENLQQMVREGIVEEAELDTFNLPFFQPTLEELEEVIEREGSFKINQVKACQVGFDVVDERQSELPLIMTRTARAVLEPLLLAHFGEPTANELFRRVGEMDLNTWIDKFADSLNLIISLSRSL